MKIKLTEIDLPEHDLRASVDENALDELAASFRDNGQKQAISVFLKPDGRYEVIFGARRTRAALLLDWLYIEATVDDEPDETTRTASKLIENVQRLDMTPMEEAYGLAALIGEAEIDVRRLQRQTGKGRSWITTRLDLIAMPEDLQAAVQAEVISIGVAKAFSTIENADVRQQYLLSAVENGCTADQAVVWAGQARFAEQGIMSMDQIREAGEDAPEIQLSEDRHYNCFVCKSVRSWRRISTVVVCGTCIDAIADIPIVDNSELPARGLDKHDTIAS